MNKQELDNTFHDSVQSISNIEDNGTFASNTPAIKSISTNPLKKKYSGLGKSKSVKAQSNVGSKTGKYNHGISKPISMNKPVRSNLSGVTKK